MRVRYHAAARELAGVREEDLPLGSLSAASLRDALATRHSALAPYLPRMRLAKNGEFSDDDARFDDADVVDVMPPVAGGAPGAVRLVDIRATPLSLDEAFAAVSHPSAGGVAIFVGVVRDHAEGKPVARLDYEAHPTLALVELRRVLEGVSEEWADARTACLHRVGELVVGDLAVVVAASAPHRADAFAACRAAIDRLKETVPIWKQEWEPSGVATWVNLEE